MVEKKNIRQLFRFRKIDETRNHFIEKINQNKLMNKKHKKVCMALNYIEQLLIFDL